MCSSMLDSGEVALIIVCSRYAIGEETFGHTSAQWGGIVTMVLYVGWESTLSAPLPPELELWLSQIT